ncbi:hypothetical protein [Companilactobacillus sp. HBUAS59544]|uniref:hypothetical protein n=1 Tax=Companilactobacillus sp. HBUAS59544 TaxID=3109363 RepID=UPI002FF23B8F
MKFNVFINQIPKDLYFPKFLINPFIGAAILALVIFIIIEIHSYRKSHVKKSMV